MSLESGSRVGSYVIIAPIGVGGMGEVYRARDEKLDREVAIKILPPEMALFPENLVRFEREARAASALNHPNIISIFDVGRSENVVWFAMELVEGSDLRTAIDEGTLTLRQVVRTATKIADGLAAAHERGIVHRDLKPENVMISREGFVKLLDFGLAKHTGPLSATDKTIPQTTPGVVFGTIVYMSPEQAAGKPLDYRSDQFSLGVMLYEMLTGRRPFVRESTAETLVAIMKEAPQPLRELVPDAPEALERLLARCMAKKRDDRFGTTREIATTLRAIRDELSFGDSLSTRRRVALPTTRRKLQLGAAAAVVVALLAGGGWYAVSSSRQQQLATLSESEARVLAVLPFRDASGTTDGRIFSAGIAETVASRLAQSGTLSVITPFEGRAVPTDMQPAKVAQQRGAGVVLTATVSRRGEMLSVNYELLKAGSGERVAQSTITKPWTDVFALEEELAREILTALKKPAQIGSNRYAAIARPADQKAFVEAVGLLNGVRDEKAVDAAISRLSGVLQNDRDSAAVNQMLGRAYHSKYTMNRDPAFIERARIYAGRAVDLDPEFAPARVTLGEVYLTTGQHRDAVAQLETALRQQPTLDIGMVALANTYEKMGRAHDAERLYERAVALSPTNPRILSRYGSFCFNRGNFEKAAALFQRAFDVDHNDHRAMTNLGAAYQGMGRSEDALRAYDRSVKILPSASGYSNLGTLQFALGRYADAASSFDKATKLSPNGYIYWMNLGDALRWAPGTRDQSAAAYAKAVEHARRTLTTDARDAETQSNMAACLAKIGQLPEADAAIAAALRSDPTRATVLYNAAVVSLLRGDPNASINWLRDAVEAGYPAADLRSDPELRPLSTRAGFQAISDRRKSSSKT